MSMGARLSVIPALLLAALALDSLPATAEAHFGLRLNTGSDAMSAPTLEEIGTMLKEHPDLRRPSAPTTPRSADSRTGGWSW